MDEARDTVRHDTVLLREAVEALDIQPDDIVVDATVGGAGHFKALLSKLGPGGMLIGIDADSEAIVRAEQVVEGMDAALLPQIRLVEDNFRNLGTILDSLGVTPTKVLFDLGWSGFQLAAGRGFSFRAEEPLLMTYGSQADQATARDMVNLLEEAQLADLTYALGEERFARGIARAIVDARKQASIETTSDLVRAIEAGTTAWYHHRRLHPATKTFQALRIGVNDELGALREGLATAIERLAPGGRAAVISFHSIEDRIVKSMLRDAAYAGKGTLVGRKPQGPSPEECAENPRARSAKLRVFEAGVPGLGSITTSNLVMYA